MNEINKELKLYIENNIFPIYSKNDSGHSMDHINYVINRSLKFASQFENININMVYTIAAFHDIAHYIDKDNHEVLSAKIFFENDTMKKFFNDSERNIIKEAIEDHRASLEYEPRSNYGKIISSADKNTSLDSALKRTHAYTMKHFTGLSFDEIIDRAYTHISEKFGKNGYAKIYVIDEEYDKFKEDVKMTLKNKDEFIKRYINVNNL